MPGDHPEKDNTLERTELITAVVLPVPATAFKNHVHYLKVRDRQSYEFALASAAVALDVQDGAIRDARIALGGVATIPWRAREAEALLRGQRFDDTLADRAAEAAFAAAKAGKHNAFKIALGKRVVSRALHRAATMEI